MKKLLSAVLCALLILVACACGGNQTDEVSAAYTPEVTVEATVQPTEASAVTETPTPVPAEEPTPVPTPMPTATPVPIDLTQFTLMYVSASSVNVRAGNSTDSKKITSLRLNTQVNAYQNIDGWYYISYGENKFGYMSAQYLADAPVVTPAPTPVPTPVDLTPWETKYNTNVDINDNVFLDALEYTGYNLSKHRADGNMWRFILGTKKQGMGYLSGLGYDYGVSTGYETTSEGKPDIQRFKARGGLVCASYLTYVYFNYLPNVAGIDTAHLTRPEYPCSAQSWRLAAEDWVAKGLSRKISFTATRYSSGIVKFTAHEEIPIGSIVVFKVAGTSDNSSARHVAIYAGYAGNGNEQAYNWLTHVGNERGPEMITIEHMGFGSTPEVPLEIITPPIYFQ